MDSIIWLQQWYTSHCRNDWQHFYGIKISTLDNPGWSIRIDLAETGLEDKLFQPIAHNMDSDDNWLHCHIKDRVFQCACSPNNLHWALDIFRSWTETN